MDGGGVKEEDGNISENNDRNDQHKSEIETEWDDVGMFCSSFQMEGRAKWAEPPSQHMALIAKQKTRKRVCALKLLNNPTTNPETKLRSKSTGCTYTKQIYKRSWKITPQ